MSLFPARLDGLYLSILVLKPSGDIFGFQYILKKSPLPLLLRHTGVEIISWPRYDGPNLRELRDGPGSILLIVALRVQNVSHFE